MKILLLLILTLFTVPSFSSVDLYNGPLNEQLVDSEIMENQTFFETLRTLYDQGTLPDLKKLKNKAWAGRCFLMDKPNQPIAAGYVFRKKSTNDVGPIGQNGSNDIFEAASYWKLKDASTFYDDKSLAYILQVLQPQFLMAEVNEREVVIYLDDGTLSKLRLSGSYLIEHLTNIKGFEGVCYYFIPRYSKP